MAGQDWDNLQAFLAAAREGTFTAAAKALGLSQPTVSRRIDELEDQLGAELFVRHSRGLGLTDRGSALLDAAEGLDSQVREVFRRSRRRSVAPEGTVRLSVNEPIGVHVLPETFASILQKYPKVQLEVIVDNSATDLTRREADLAVRMFEPIQGDLVAKKLGHVPLHFFASKDFVNRHPGCHQSDVSRYPTIGLDSDPSWSKMLREFGLRPDAFPLRTDSLLLQLTAAAAGVGVVGTHPKIGERFGLVRVFEDLELPGYPVWLVQHSGLRSDLAVRKVADEIEASLRAYLAD